mmetsp:Transcript_4734/g.16337  ORF Transcript_4734/g.16337 Transcript_4734/m.16337 type:complete len:279 (-) Transcript_4734:148-984(-)
MWSAPARAFAKRPLHLPRVHRVSLERLPSRPRRVLFAAENRAVRVRERAPQIIHRSTPHHRSLNRAPARRQMIDRRRRLVAPLNPTVEDEPQVRKVARERVHVRVLERRHRAVLRRREPGEDGFPCVNDERPRRGRRRVHRLHKLAELLVRVSVVDADAALDRRLRRCLPSARRRLRYRRHSLPHLRRRLHERCAEAALARHLWARAPHVQVYFVVAVRERDARRLVQLLRVAPAELQRYRVLLHGKVEGATNRLFVEDERAINYHFCVKPSVLREQP